MNAFAQKRASSPKALSWINIKAAARDESENQISVLQGCATQNIPQTAKKKENKSRRGAQQQKYFDSFNTWW